MDAVTIKFCADSFRALSMKDLGLILDGLVAARDGLVSVLNQPRCTGEAEDELDDTVDAVHDAIDLLASIANEATPIEPDEVKARAWLLLGYHARLRDDLPQLAALATSLAADLSKANFAQTHREKRNGDA
ncbi:hypothetical protein SAMN02927900_01274 [Rhizobium mongolense subsp. loessense]|uniref:Uncharacterized protein n=1 Tax=Rhizobium mongolense subsp. loessense TaxID=158890 RepID=A0A1G4Q2S9_9HYPH|nr:hypothetical protein [Rhizobium mongolense]SCW38866.1 hypothetical protein SAMN02927900_01274 [Rhizobium mongolense subsp. loessense]